MEPTDDPKLSELLAEIDKQPVVVKDNLIDGKEKLAKRQANAAVALLKMGQSEKIWPLLRQLSIFRSPPNRTLSTPPMAMSSRMSNRPPLTRFPCICGMLPQV